MKKRQWIISGIMTLLLLMGAAFGYQKMAANKQSTVSEEKPTPVIREVDTQQFEAANITNNIEIDGRLSAFEKINIGAEVTGKLLPTSRHNVGSYFEEGDLLFQVDSNDERYNLFAQRSSLLTAITQMMPDLKFDYPASFQTWKKYLDDFDVEKYVKPLPTVQDQKEKYYISGKNIYNLYYSIKSAEDRLKNYNIYAPFSGVFLSVNVFPGALVSPGTSLGQVMNTTRFELVAPIGMADLKYVRKGQQVKLFSEELGKSWTGVVNRISNQIDQATQSVPLYIGVMGAGLKDGVFLKGTLKGNTIKGAYEIPRSILVNQNEVWTYNDGKVAKKEVTIISRSDEKLIVEGIQPADQIIVSGVNNLYEGQEVTLRK